MFNWKRPHPSIIKGTIAENTVSTVSAYREDYLHKTRPVRWMESAEQVHSTQIFHTYPSPPTSNLGEPASLPTLNHNPRDTLSSILSIYWCIRSHSEVQYFQLGVLVCSVYFIAPHCYMVVSIAGIKWATKSQRAELNKSADKK